jgi:signal peptidase II
LLIVLDQVSKSFFKDLYNQKGQTTVIEGFFYLTHVVNTGAAWSFLGDKPWAQTFFKIMTILAIVAFIFGYIYSFIKNYRWLQYGVSIAFAGTIGNFIDRLTINGVNDFLSFVFGTYHFPVFNVADICLCVGVAMIIIHLFFFDEGGLFVGKKKDEQN